MALLCFNTFSRVLEDAGVALKTAIEDTQAALKNAVYGTEEGASPWWPGSARESASPQKEAKKADTGLAPRKGGDASATKKPVRDQGEGLQGSIIGAASGLLRCAGARIDEWCGTDGTPKQPNGTAGHERSRT